MNGTRFGWALLLLAFAVTASGCAGEKTDSTKSKSNSNPTPKTVNKDDQLKELRVLETALQDANGKADYKEDIYEKDRKSVE